MSNVITLSGAETPDFGAPEDGLIALLEDTLALARSGRLRSFVGTGFTSDGCRLAVWGPLDPDVYKMRGAIAWLEGEYVHKITVGSHE